MLDKLLKITGTLALYGCASMFLATLLLGAYLMYAWNIDKNKRIMLLALAQGLDVAAVQQAVEDRIAEMSYDQVLELRAKRLREEEAKGVSSERPVNELLLADGQKVNAELQKIRSEREAFERYVKDWQERNRAAGLAEETRLLEEAEPEWARDRILELLLYGPLLPNTMQDWLDDFKDAYSSQSIDLLKNMLDIEVQRNHQDMILRLADIMFLHDPLNEEALAGKCAVLSAQGKKGIARNVYDRFCKEYRNSMGEDYKVPFADL